jgi:DNA-binding transcriptional MerR regulator
MNGLTIGEVAQQAKVHIEALRNYERRGLIERPPRSASNYRLYPESESVSSLPIPSPHQGQA